MTITHRNVDFKIPGHEWNGVVSYENDVPTFLDFYVWNAGPCELWHITMSEDLSKELGEELWITEMRSGNGHGSARITREKPVTVLNRITMDSEIDPALSALSHREAWPNAINARTGRPLLPYAVTGEIYTVSRGSEWIATVQIDANEDLIGLELQKFLKDFFVRQSRSAVR